MFYLDMRIDMDDRKTNDEIINAYRDDIAKLAKYLPWLESKSGRDVVSEYHAAEQTAFSFPVYDSTLLSFLKEAKETRLINRNYRYTYTRYRIRNAADERRFISRATIRQFKELGDILSKYVLLGMTKSQVWTEGIENRIFLDVVTKLKELIEFWDKPLA